jgi:hypothetical protein
MMTIVVARTGARHPDKTYSNPRDCTMRTVLPEFIRHCISNLISGAAQRRDGFPPAASPE